MSNFLDLEDRDRPSPERSKLRELLASVPTSTPRPHLDPKVSDQLASQHGFSSRDHSSELIGLQDLSRRNPRGASAERTKQLSIRMPISLYTEFLAYADKSRLTYSEAIRSLLDRR